MERRKNNENLIQTLNGTYRAYLHIIQCRADRRQLSALRHGTQATGIPFAKQNISETIILNW